MAINDGTQKTRAEAIEGAEAVLGELGTIVDQAWAAATALEEHHRDENDAFARHMSALVATLLDQTADPQGRLRAAIESIKGARY